MKRIKEPGKFEGEHVSAPHFWNLILEGGGDVQWEDNNLLLTRVDIKPEDREKFSGIPDQAEHVVLWERDDGFVTMDFEDNNFALLVW